MDQLQVPTAEDISTVSNSSSFFDLIMWCLITAVAVYEVAIIIWFNQFSWSDIYCPHFLRLSFKPNAKKETQRDFLILVWVHPVRCPGPTTRIKRRWFFLCKFFNWSFSSSFKSSNYYRVQPLHWLLSADLCSSIVLAVCSQSWIDQGRVNTSFL